ncbi:hypothetical protein MMC22_002391 [Lobaria immixta]|nr:hypothetical protein [Lobaria immixta]
MSGFRSWLQALLSDCIAGIAVSAAGRKFTSYPSSLDANNTKYSVAELTSNDTETPYPSAEINAPPGGSINYTTSPPTGANYQDYFISVQGIVIDAKDRLWLLDTGRALTPSGTLVPASHGGPKLIGINLSNSSIFKTIVFPTEVAFSESYLNDIRIDLRPNVTSSGQGIGYITDSSGEGRNGIVIVDLGTGESWRHLDNAPQVRADPQYVPFVAGDAVYALGGTQKRITYVTDGADGIALSPDGETLYWTAVGSAYLHSIPTARLRDNSLASEIRAQAAISSRGNKGTSDGIESDSNGLVYLGNFEQNAINTFNPETGLFSVFVRDPRLSWSDSLFAATDGYLYFTENQLWRRALFFPGTDRRVRPYTLFRVKLLNNGSKILSV